MTPWDWLPINRLATVTLGKMVQSQPKDGGDIERPYVRAAHIQPLGKWFDASEQTMYFSPTEAAELDVCRGDVLVVEGGAGYGRSFYVSQGLTGWGFQNSINRLRPYRSRCDGRFLAYALQDGITSGRVELEASVATIPHFTAEKISSFRVPAPDVHVQRGIAEYLDRETAKIDALTAKQKELASALASERSARRDRLIDVAWSIAEAEPLRHSAEVTVGIVVTPSAWYDDSGVLALRGLNVREERLDTSDVVFLTAEGDQLHRKSSLRPGDVVVVRTGQAGTAAVVPPQLAGANAIDLLIVRPRPALDGEYIAMILNGSRARSEIASVTVGAIQGHFNVSALRGFRVPVPKIPVQLDLVRRWRIAAAASDELSEGVRLLLSALQERRSALISAAVTGQIDVTNYARGA